MNVKELDEYEADNRYVIDVSIDKETEERYQKIREETLSEDLTSLAAKISKKRKIAKHENTINRLKNKQNMSIFEPLPHRESVRFNFKKSNLLCKSETDNSVQSKSETSDSGQKDEKENKTKKSLAYEIFKMIMKKHNLKCWKGQIFDYYEREGRFIYLDENSLKVLIRTGWEEKIQEKLSRNVVIEIIDRLTSEPTIQIGEDYFNCNTHMMNFLNGVLDLNTNELLEHSPDYKFTHCIQANYTFNPKGGHTFRKFIKTCMESNVMKEQHLREVVGYMLSEFYTAKKAPMLIGKPHSGKSTLNRIISTLIGSDHVANVPLHRLHEKFILAHLSTKKINVCSEISDEALSNIEVFKNITGNDPLVAEHKGKPHFTYKSKIKLLFAGNSMPILKNSDVTSAFFDRLTFINFNFTVPEDRRDHNLEKKLLDDEKEFIVAWAVEGVKRLMENNFVFSESKESIDFKKRYIIEQNNITEFINSYCNLEPRAKVHIGDLYYEYLRYCHENCFNACSQKELRSEMSKYNVTYKKIRINRSKPLWGYEGINLKTESEVIKDFENKERLEQMASNVDGI